MMERDRQHVLQTDPVPRRPETRPVPIPAESVATSSAAAVFTAPEGSLCLASGLLASNGSASSRTITLHIGDDATGDASVLATTIAANSVLDLSGYFMIPAGQKLWALASGSDVRISGWATAYL